MSEIRISDRATTFLPEQAAKKQKNCFMWDCVVRLFAAIACCFKTMFFCFRDPASLKSKISHAPSDIASDRSDTKSKKPVNRLQPYNNFTPKVKGKNHTLNSTLPSTPLHSMFTVKTPPDFYPKIPPSSEPKQSVLPSSTPLSHTPQIPDLFSPIKPTSS